MGELTPDQLNVLYIQEAERTGIHKPILAALQITHSSPSLADGMAGLGVAPANRIALEQVDTLIGQVHYAANTIRSLTNSLTVEGWKGADIWNSVEGNYTEQFVQAIANGYVPPASDPTATRLEASDPTALLHAYTDNLLADFQAAAVPPDQSYLDAALLTFIKAIPSHYIRLPYQRQALLEMTRLWCKVDTQPAAIQALQKLLAEDAIASSWHLLGTDPFQLDVALMQFLQHLPQHYAGYPHQREALLLLAQRWRQLDSRELAIASLASDASAEPNPAIIDAALIATIQQIPQQYAARGDQRHALVEGFRLWQQFGTRSDALIGLGVNPEIFISATPQPVDVVNAAKQVDQALLQFFRQVPQQYNGSDTQREALTHLIQLWRGLATADQTLLSLYADLAQMEQAQRDAPEAPPPPVAAVFATPPPRWMPENLQLFAAITPNGSLTWAEATQGGTYLPANQAAVDAIVRIAELAQQVSDRLGRSLKIISWYCPAGTRSKASDMATSRYAIGDAIAFYCPGLTGDQLYWFLDPWWTGGLGRYAHFPYLCHIDARGYRARWLQ